MVNLHTIYHRSDIQTRIAVIALITTAVLSLLTAIFLSASAVVVLSAATVVAVFIFLRPQWMLAFLLFYLPFEPFVLKWFGDNLYIYAKYGSELVIYLLVLAVLWRVLTGEIKFKSSPIDLPFVLLILIMFASAIINWIPAFTAILGIRQIIRFILLFFVVYQLEPSVKWIRNVLFGMFIVVAVQVTVAYLQFLSGGALDNFLLPSAARAMGDIQFFSGVQQFWDPGKRLFATMGRYDQLGTFLAFFFLLLSALLYEPRLVKYHNFFAALLMIGLPVLALTYSRSSWFGFIFGFLFISLWGKKDKRVLKVLYLFIGAVVLYLFISGIAVGNLIERPDQGLMERFFEAFSYRRWVSEYYGLGRLYWIIQTIVKVVPAAFVFGHGPGMYGGGVAAALSNTTVYDRLGLPFGVYGTTGFIDNNWFSIWGELGTLGLMIYLWMYATLFFLCINVWRKSHYYFTRVFALGVAATMIAVALNAFLATFLEARTLAPYLWVMTGLVALLAYREKIWQSHVVNYENRTS